MPRATENPLPRFGSLRSTVTRGTAELRQQAGRGGLARVVDQNQLGGPRLGGGKRPQHVQMRRQTLGAVPHGHDHRQVDCAISHAHKDTAPRRHAPSALVFGPHGEATVSAASGTIEHVSDTARWVALYRAMESERPDALFRDPYARKLAGERGERILASMRRGRAWAWPMIVRTA